MDTGKNIYFEGGQYYFGYDKDRKEPITEESLIPIDRYAYKPLSDAAEVGLVFVERDGKQGVMIMYRCGQGGYGKLLHTSNIFPFIYDEMWLNGSIAGDGIGFVAVRINNYWGVLRVTDIEEKIGKHIRRRCILIIPCVYPTKEAAIARIEGSDFHPEFGWRDPFAEEEFSEEQEL